MFIQQVPVVFSLGVGLRRRQPCQPGNLRMDGWLPAGLQPVQITGNDFRRGQPVLLRVPL